MDKQTFLASGLLEQYVLGITDPEETQEVERHLNLYPELHQEVAAMREAIKQYALQQEIPAPAQKTNAPQSTSNTTNTKTYGQIHWLSVVVLGALALLCVLSALRMRNLQEENKTLLTQLSTALRQPPIDPSYPHSVAACQLRFISPARTRSSRPGENSYRDDRENHNRSGAS